jgi:transcriptional regulator with XRE-family HTH domain
MKLRLKEFRKANGMTQRVVAEKAGMAVSYYTELELGKKQINANRLQALARVFGVAPQALIDEPRAGCVQSV